MSALDRDLNRRAQTARDQLAQAAGLASNDWERNFVQSVTDQVNRGRTVSSKQQTIIDRILASDEPDEGAYVGVSDLLQRAGTRLRRPRITFAVDMTTVRVSLAPANGRNPDNAYITIGDIGPGWSDSHTYYGRITPGGVLVTSGATDLQGLDESSITTFLSDLSRDPAQAAREYGARTGRCCFCNLPLKTVESTSHGYGPVCANHYDLPWSRSSANAILDDETEANRAVVFEANGGTYNVVDTETGDTIATFEDRLTAQAYADEWSTVERATDDQ